jgi:sulfite exporter TauE/SafE
MATLIGTVLLASLLGSLHCASMCGAFAAFATMPRPEHASGRLGMHVAYHGGRLAVYVVFGALAGVLGAALDIGGTLVGVQRAAAIVAGIVLVAAGLIASLRLFGVRLPPLAAAPVLGHWIRKGHETAFHWPPVFRALAVGLMTALLPCGWLWAFVVAAAGTGHALFGAVTLAAFWVGTVPVLAAIGAGFERLTGLLGVRTQLAACLVVIGLGVLALAGRWTPPAAVHTQSAPPACVDEAVERVEALRGAPPGCEHAH